MDFSAEEKRQHARHHESICAWLSFCDDHALYGTITVDVGVGGARFNTQRCVKTGDHVLLNMQVEPKSVECKGRVCWTNCTEDGLNAFGVKFYDLRDDEREHLRKYFKQESHSSVAAAIAGVPV